MLKQMYFATTDATMRRFHKTIWLLLVCMTWAVFAAGCGDDTTSDTAEDNAPTELSMEALAGKWELDRDDRREYLLLRPDGTFGGTVTFDGLATTQNPPDTYSKVFGHWTLEGTLLTFHIVEASLSRFHDTTVQHRILDYDGKTMRTIFEDEHEITIYRR